MIGHRSTSPHSSLSSSGSEEVRCSLDELDAVIATFDEEARQHCQSLSQLRSDISALTNGHIHRRGSLEGTFSSANSESLDYTSATLRNPRCNRLDLALVRTPADSPTNGNDALPSFTDDDFPPPPPDAFAPENFILPPPSPPPPTPPSQLSPSLSPVLVRGQPGDQNIRSESTKPSSSTGRVSYPASPSHGAPAPTTDPTAERPNGSRPVSGAVCRRPVVPQRAPSTRLSSVPVTCNGTDEPRPQSLTVDSLVPIKESRGSVESLPISHVKLASSNCVSPVRERSNVSKEEDTGIDQTVPPVSDIIRQFDRRGQLIVGASCRPGFVPPKLATNGTRDDSHINAVPATSNESITTHPDRKSSVPVNSFNTTAPIQSPFTGDDQPSLVSLPQIQQLVTRGFTLSRSNSVESNRRTLSGQGLCPVSPLTRISNPSALSPTAVSMVSPITVPCPTPDSAHLTGTCSPNTGQFWTPKHAPESRMNSQTASSTPQLSSFGSVRRISSSSRHSPPLPSPPVSTAPPPSPQSATLSSHRSNSISHRGVGPSEFGVTSCHPTMSSKSTLSSSSPQPPSSFTPIPQPPPPPPPPPLTPSPPSSPSVPSAVPPILVPANGFASTVLGQTVEQAKTQVNPQIAHHQQLTNALQQRRGSIETRPTAEKQRSISVHSMRLDPGTLETLVQFNIASAHQIPGYQFVPPGLPDWKTHKLERKNRDAADAYAADLRKWGCIPQWKRELIEKRHHGKNDSGSANGSHPDPTHSLISAELTEKLQRRLEKVAAMAES